MTRVAHTWMAWGDTLRQSRASSCCQGMSMHRDRSMEDLLRRLGVVCIIRSTLAITTIKKMSANHGIYKNEVLLGWLGVVGVVRGPLAPDAGMR